MSRSPHLCNCHILGTTLHCPFHNPLGSSQAQQWYPTLSGSTSLYLPDPELAARYALGQLSQTADQPFVGFRAWRAESTVSAWRLTPFSPLRYLPTGVTLRSLTANGPTEPWNDPVAHAACRYAAAGVHEDKRSPNKNCACGLYTWRRPGAVNERRTHVWGAVLIWGRVLEHDEGFRSEHAKIICFADNGNEITEYAARQRGIPVVPPDKVAIYAGEFGRVFP